MFGKQATKLLLPCIWQMDFPMYQLVIVREIKIKPIGWISKRKESIIEIVKTSMEEAMAMVLVEAEKTMVVVVKRVVSSIRSSRI